MRTVFRRSPNSARSAGSEAAFALNFRIASSMSSFIAFATRSHRVSASWTPRAAASRSPRTTGRAAGKLPTHGALELDFVHVRRVHVRRLRPQLRDDLGEQFRLEVVEGHLRPHYVNLLRRDHDDLELRHLLDLGGEGLPFLRREFLRV